MNKKHLSAAVHKMRSSRRIGLRRGKVVAVALAASLALGMGAAPAWAYFTDSHHADGGLPIKGQPDTDIHEWYAEATKHVVITNDEEAGLPVFVRAKVQTSLTFEAVGKGWSAKPDEDGWYYYDTVVDPGAETQDLTVKVTFPTVKSEEQPDGTAVYGDNYSVIVLYESTPAIYDENGNPVIDWNYEWPEEDTEGGN